MSFELKRLSSTSVFMSFTLELISIEVQSNMQALTVDLCDLLRAVRSISMNNGFQVVKTLRTTRTIKQVKTTAHYR